MQASVTFRLFTAESLPRLGKGVACFGGAALLALGATMTPIAWAQLAPGSTGLDTSGNSKSELAACNSGKTAQDRATCLTEVRRAQAARRSGKLENYGDFTANALKRCEVFKNPEDLAACRARVQQPTIEGSVTEGGILREAEIVTQTPGTPPPAGTMAPGTTTEPGATMTPETTTAPGTTTAPENTMAPGTIMAPETPATPPASQ